jgi:hypothetical protein
MFVVAVIMESVFVSSKFQILGRDHLIDPIWVRWLLLHKSAQTRAET